MKISFRQSFAITKRHTFCYTFLFLCTYSLNVRSQNQVPDQENVRKSFERFFQMDKIVPVTPAVAPGEIRNNAKAVIRRQPGKDAKRDRLLKYQEARTPQPDVRNFIENDATFDEVAIGEDVDFAQVYLWNHVSLRTTANDHTAPAEGSSIATNPFEQVGPARTSRALAIVHIAIFEAVNAIFKEYNTYHGLQQQIYTISGVPQNTAASEISVRHAIAYAAHRTLSELYPRKRQEFDLILTNNLASLQVPQNQANLGMKIGLAASTAILNLRQADGSELPDPPVDIFRTNDPLKWQRDPLNSDPAVALGANWKYVKPFVLLQPEQFRPAVPPALESQRYKDAFTQVFNLGGDPDAGKADPPGNANRLPTTTQRSDDQTFIGKFWAYDGTALLCAPPRLYNMIATSLALKEKRGSFSGPTSALQFARFLALVNIAMADAGIAAWEAKYYYLYPRPVTAIRAATPSTAPISASTNVKFWSPLGAPVSNAKRDRVNFTPPFPAYPSGHATFGGAIFQIFRRYWGSDEIKFIFVSDEYNGRNSDPGSPTPRPLTPVTFNNFIEAEKANADSRIYLGIHWEFDATEGVRQGNQVGNYIFDNVLSRIQP